MAAVAYYEENLRKAIRNAVEAGMTYETIHDHPYIYEDLFDAGYNFIYNVALSGRNYGRLQDMGIDRDDAAAILAENIFLYNLDTLLTSDSKLGYLGLVCNTVNWRVGDLVKSAKRRNNERVEPKADIVESGTEEYETGNLNLTDVGWALMSDGTDIEADYIEQDERRRTALAVLGAAKHHKNAFEVVSFFAKDLLQIDRDELNDLMNRRDAEQLRRDILVQVARTYHLPNTYFDDAAFMRKPMNTQRKSEAARLSAISNASANVAKTIRKVLHR